MTGHENMAFTQKDFKLLVKEGAAKDITSKGKLPKGARKIAVSRTKEGINGELYVSESGKLYVAFGRYGYIYARR